MIIEHGHPLEGKSMAGKVMVFPYGKGSTVGSYVLYALSMNGHAPAAIINLEAEPIIAVGAIIGDIPMVDRLTRTSRSFKTASGYGRRDKGEVEYPANGGI